MPPGVVDSSRREHAAEPDGGDVPVNNIKVRLDNTLRKF